MSRPTVTIVTPCYNHKDYIEWTLRCVLCQDYPNIEYLVYDAVSTDGTEEILRRYEPYIDRLVIAKDKGQTDALNRAFANSTGSIMGYLNSDDGYTHASVISQMVDYFEANPDADVICGDRHTMDEQGRYYTSYPLRPFNRDKFVQADFLAQEAVFWRRSIYDKVGGYMNTSFDFAMDYELFLRFLEGGAKFLSVPERWGLFRYSPSQKSMAQWKNKGLPEIERLLRPYLGDRPFIEEDMYTAMGEHLFGAAYQRNPEPHVSGATFWHLAHQLKQKQYETDRLDAWVAHTPIHPARGSRRAA